MNRHYTIGFDGDIEMLLLDACSSSVVMESKSCFCLSCQKPLFLRSVGVVNGQVQCGICKRHSVTGDASLLPLDDPDFVLMVGQVLSEYE